MVVEPGDCHPGLPGAGGFAYRRDRGSGVSGMVPNLILLEAQGDALYPFIQRNDARTVKEIVDFCSQVNGADT